MTGRDLLLPNVAANPSRQHALALIGGCHEPRNIVTDMYSRFMARSFNQPICVEIGPGAGRKEGPTWIGVDVRLFAEVDLLASVTTLPFANEVISHIVMGNTLEHVPSYETMIVLRELHRVLVPGGKLNISVPKIEGIIRMLSKGLQDVTVFQDAMRQLYGPQDDPLVGFHYTIFEEKRFLVMLMEAGFRFSGWVYNTDMGCHAYVEKV